MLGMVSTRRRAERRSGASLPKATPCPFEFNEFCDKTKDFRGTLEALGLDHGTQEYSHLHPLSQTLSVTEEIPQAPRMQAEQAGHVSAFQRDLLYLGLVKRVADQWHDSARRRRCQASKEGTG